MESSKNGPFGVLRPNGQLVSEERQPICTEPAGHLMVNRDQVSSRASSLRSLRKQTLSVFSGKGRPSHAGMLC